jgi:hypothetical protein
MTSQSNSPSKTQPDPMALRYFPLALYTFGCCHYGHKEPFRTGEVAADSLLDAWRKARVALSPGPTEHICHVSTKPYPEFFQEQARWVALRTPPTDSAGRAARS